MPSLTRKQTQPQDEAFLATTRRMADLLADKRAKDIRGYDVRGLTLVADALLISTATSEPQMKAAYNAVVEGMKEVGVRPLATEGAYSGGWILLDYGDVICHIFREQARAFYDLDGMWADAKPIELDLEE